MKENKKYKCFYTGFPINAGLCDYTLEQSQNLHNHEYIEIAIIASGVGIHKIDNNNYTIKKGEVYIINSESIHRFAPVDDENSQNLSIIFINFYDDYFYDLDLEPSLFKNIINMLLFKSHYPQENKFAFALSPEELEETKYLFRKMEEELTANKSGITDALKYYLGIMLINFSRYYSRTIKSVPQTNKHHFSLVKNVIHYLNAHFSENVNLNDISEYCHMSPRHISRVFKEATSLTIFEYLQKIRIEKACFLLNTTDTQITDVVQLVGFSDYRYFSKIFKSYTGMTPKKYASNTKF